MSSKVSICLPVFNGQHYLGAAIESVLAQTYENFELLVVDDCSTDRSNEIIQSYAANDARIIYTRNSNNVGLFTNYNRCLEQASGEFIKPFAQDDLLHPKAIEHCVQILESEPTVVLVSMTRGFINSAGETIQSVDFPAPHDVFPANCRTSGNQVIQKCLLSMTNYIGEPSTVLFRKSAIQDGFDPSFHHLGDLDYWLRILLAGDYFFAAQKYCYFRVHKKSTSSANAKGFMHGPDLLRMIAKFDWILEGCGEDSAKFRDEILQSYSLHVLRLLDSGVLTLGTLQKSEDLLSRVPSEPGVGVDGSVQDLIKFRELAFHALRLLGDQLTNKCGSGTSPVVVLNMQMIGSLEAEARTLLESSSWRMTRALREGRKVFGSNEGGSEPLLLDMNPGADMLAQQTMYIQYLSDLITRIKLSRSWRITKPLRRLEQLKEAKKATVTPSE